MSRRTWERHRNKACDAILSAAYSFPLADRPASPEGKAGLPNGAVAPKKARSLPSSQTAPTLAADRYEALPLELRLLALGLPMPEKLAAAA